MFGFHLFSCVFDLGVTLGPRLLPLHGPIEWTIVSDFDNRSFDFDWGQIQSGDSVTVLGGSHTFDSGALPDIENLRLVGGSIGMVGNKITTFPTEGRDVWMGVRRFFDGQAS